MYVLHASTTDDYPNEPPGAILICPSAVRVNIRTTIKEVSCQMMLKSVGGGLKGNAGTWGPDVNLGRSIRSLDRRIEAIRFKSTTAGQAGTIDVEAMTEDEIFSG